MAYADPVYLGCGRLYPEHPESRAWDDPETHRALIARLVADYPDGWALSLSSTSLHTILPMCPADVRIAAWVKTFCAFKRGVRPCYSWEPVIFRGGRNPPHTPHPPPPRGGKQTTPKDHLLDGWPDASDALPEPITLRKGLTGAKPARFCSWVLDLLGARAGDTIDDLFPGTGAMGRAVETVLADLRAEVRPGRWEVDEEAP
jgi:hypothetical protein